MIDPVLATGVLLTAFGFWLGAVPFGVIIGRLLGVDVRQEGSGNIGATNVARTAGKRAGVLVLLLDAAKGAFPIFAWLFFVQPQPTGYWAIAIGLAPIIGHCFSPWLRLRGGKGVATSLGVFLALDPLAAGIGFVVFAVAYSFFRVASIGSMAGAIAIAVVMAATQPPPLAALAIAAAALIIVRHRGNLVRLFTHSELRV